MGIHPIRLFAFGWVFLAMVFVPLGRNSAAQVSRIVGSRTGARAIIAAIEKVSETIGEHRLIFEPSDTDAGFALLCAGRVDGTIATRPISAAESAACKRRGISLAEPRTVGNLALLLVTSRDTQERGLRSLTVEEIFASLAATVFRDGESVENAAWYWAGVAPHLPRMDIQYMLPARSSEAFTILIMMLDGECRRQRRAAGIDRSDGPCFTLRHDVVEDESPREMRAWMAEHPGAVAIIERSQYQSLEGVVGVIAIAGITPTEHAIRNHQYPLSRPVLFFCAGNRADLGIGELLDRFDRYERGALDQLDPQPDF